MCSGAICYSLAFLHSKWVEYVLLFRNATIPQGKYRLKTIKRVTRQAVKFFYYSWHNILERNNTSICICACISFFLKFSKKVSIIKVFLLIQSIHRVQIWLVFLQFSQNFRKYCTLVSGCPIIDKRLIPYSVIILNALCSTSIILAVWKLLANFP